MPATKRKTNAPELEKTTKKSKLSIPTTPSGDVTRPKRTTTKQLNGAASESHPGTGKPTKSTARLAAKPNKVEASTKQSSKIVSAPATADDFAGFSDSDDAPEDPSRRSTTAGVEASLLAGFSDSESEGEAAEDEKAIKTIPKIPTSASLDKQLVEANKSVKASDPERTPGTVIISRIPHGFYEPQMKAYFSQFGEIKRLRLSRNKKTGKSKHYAFVEFKAAAVADIVARTMDKYLLFGHILQVRLMRPEEIHADLWKGANKRFKVMPRSQLEAGRLRRGRGREAWEKKVKVEKKRRSKKAEQLKALGYDYEFEAPEIRKVSTVPKPAAANFDEVVVGDVEQAAEDTPKSVEAPAVTAEEPSLAEMEAEDASSKRKKGRKEKKTTKKARLSE